MVVYKSSAVARFIKTPKADCRAVLVYGPDAGLVAERASALAQIFARRGQGQTEIIRLDDRDLAEDPARLEVELRTIPMFAEQSVVRVTAGPKLDVPALKTLLADDFANFLIVEAGNLRPDSGLRKLFEGHRSAVALPCYGDESLLSELIDAELARAGLGIDREARDYLMTRLGADQALSRAEVVKLALYAQGQGTVSHHDIEAIVGDAAETALENFVYATSGGDAKAALSELQRLAASGTDRASALSALGRHFIQLHRVAAAVASGRPAEEALRSLRPPPRPKTREEAFLARSRKWGAGRLAKVLPIIQEAVRRSRRSPDLEGAFAERLVLALTSKI
ncbi:MAG: DNA polymerase III subunit delta [Methyloceanibacter sp.]|jgi:DNA polymerase III subunit delta|nr:DNA polymerase III subunit delta [Methyloceanibacter sp.]